MATYAQRASAIVDALVNGPSTVEQQQRVAAAFTGGALDAQMFVRKLRNYVLSRIESHEAEAAVEAARSAVAADVAADFTEAP